MFAKQLLFISLFLSSFAFAGQISFRFQEASNGVIQFRLIGSDLCDAYNEPGTFGMVKGYVSERGQFQASSEYISGSGQTNWKITKGCGINQQLSNDLLEPGKALAVQVYDQYNRILETHYIQIPCSQEFGMKTEEYLFSTDVTVLSATVCGAAGSDVSVVRDVEEETVRIPNQPPVIVIEPAPVRTQSCDYNLVVDSANPRLVAIRLGCSQSDAISIQAVESNGNGQEVTVFNDYIRVNASSNRQTVATFVRDNPTKTSNVRLILNSINYNWTRTHSQTLTKIATFNYDVEARLMTPISQSPKGEDTFLGNQTEFEASLEVYVEDRDIDTKNPENVIRVQLYNTTGGRFDLVEEKRVSSNSNVRFDLFGQYLKPIMWGSNQWDEDHILTGGQNTFTLRFFDAYQNQNYIDLQNIVINLPLN